MMKSLESISAEVGVKCPLNSVDVGFTPLDVSRRLCVRFGILSKKKVKVTREWLRYKLMGFDGG